MPLSPFQTEILRLLAANPSPDSYVAGGVALNARGNVRWSDDVDLFHDAEEAVMRSSERDAKSLTQAGYSVRQDLWTPAYRRAWVSKAKNGVKLEWCQDSAWRFFKIESDDLLGWKLHRFDALANKALAMAGRSETRDLVDIVSNAGQYPLHVICWAACGKDPGYNPLLLLNQMQRNSRINQAELREMGSTFEPVALKTQWLAIAERALEEIHRAASSGIEPGVAFLDAQDRICWFDAPGAVPCKPSLGGSLPRIPGIHYDL